MSNLVPLYICYKKKKTTLLSENGVMNSKCSRSAGMFVHHGKYASRPVGIHYAMFTK